MATMLAAAALVLAVGGAFGFVRFAARVRRDPAIVYRDPGTLDQVLQRASDAERAGDRGAAVVLYRFVVAVGRSAPGQLVSYVARAQAGLRRLGASDTLPGPPR
ncbi:MAG TPA: hypothetical protein VEU55_04580 [Gemmatimonadales bacterium]|nr:hypothetical protein [Gemmatimonadales bacterium]